MCLVCLYVDRSQSDAHVDPNHDAQSESTSPISHIFGTVLEAQSGHVLRSVAGGRKSQKLPKNNERFVPLPRGCIEALEIWI